MNEDEEYKTVMNEEVEIQFIDLAIKSVEETLDLANRIYDRVKARMDESEDYAKQKITFEIAKDIWDVSTKLSINNLFHLQKAFSEYLDSKEGKHVLKEEIKREIHPKIENLFKKVNGE